MTPRASLSARVALASLLCAVVFLPACGGDRPTGRPFTVARYYWPGEFWVEIADRKGWFREAGLNVTLVDTNPDYHASLAAATAGRIDTNAFYLYDLMRHRAGGADLVMVVNSDLSFGAEGLVAGGGIASVSDLRGRRIGLPRGTVLEYLLDVVLRRSGLTLDDVVLVDIPGEQAAKVFIEGGLDAVFTWEPGVSAAVAGGRGRKLFDTAEIPGVNPVGYAFLRRFLRERPGDVRAFVRVWERTTRYIRDRPEEALGIIAGIYGRSLDEVRAFMGADKILDLEDNLLSFSHSHGFESLAGAADHINASLLRRGVIQEALDHEAFLDAGFIRDLDRKGRR